MAEICPICKKEMELTEKKVIADTDYNIYECKKCNRKVAKNMS